jgi:hypothetical protein
VFNQKQKITFAVKLLFVLYIMITKPERGREAEEDIKKLVGFWNWARGCENE